MSAFVLSLAVMPLIYGPASDRFGPQGDSAADLGNNM
jgi:hypothetical protein